MVKSIIIFLGLFFLSGCTTPTEKYEKQLIKAGCKPSSIIGTYKRYECTGVEGYPPNVTIWE